MNKTRKTRNKAYHEAMVELRHGNAAQPHRNKAKYHRASAKRDWRKDI